MHLAVRTSGKPFDLVVVRAQVASIDKEQPIFDLKTVEQIFILEMPEYAWAHA
jgi:hypothetical protein